MRFSVIKVLLIACMLTISIAKGGMVMALELTSSAFKNSEYIPKKYTGEGADVSPALAWSNPPQGTKSFALICDDPDAPMGDWVHWVIYNIPAGVNTLPEAVPQEKVLKDGISQGKNNFGRIGYNGPMPPPGKPHRYFFKLYALDAELNLAPGLLKKELLKLMETHVLEEAQLMGMYRR